MKYLLITAVVTAGFAVGCSDDSGQQSQQATYYKDVKPVMDAYCGDCHNAGGIGPFELTTLEQVVQTAPIIKPAIMDRSMPPFIAAPAVRELQFDRSLSQEQIDLIVGWIDAGMPAGDPANEGQPIELPQSTVDDTDLTLEMPEPFEPTISPDEYRCFVIDWPETEPKFATAFELIPSNLNVAHHSAAYLIDGSDQIALVESADGADGKDGYPCFGGATPNGAESSIPSKFIAAWVPGSGAVNFPEGSGVLIEPGSKIVLQMHYNIQTAEPGETDQSSMNFQVADDVEQRGGHLPWLDVAWVGQPENMSIPAGQETVVHEYVGDPTVSPLLGEFAPGVDGSEGLYIHNTLPHLHKLGESFLLQLERADGTTEKILEIKDWDFDWQNFFTYQEPVLVKPGDQLRMRCEWNNTMANQPIDEGGQRTPQDVGWGDNSDDEMCVAAMFVTGVSKAVNTCEGSIPAESGRFEITFDTTQRDNPSLDGEFRGPVSGSIFRDEDVTLLGPKDGAEAVANFDFDEIDLTQGPDGPYLIDVELPAGEYQFLGYMDTDDNVDEFDGPDVNDPVIIPSGAVELGCETQRVTVQFPILRPNL